MQIDTKVHRVLVGALMIGLVATVAVAQEQVIRLSEPVAVTATHETFGSAMPDTVQRTNLAKILAEPDSYIGETFALDTRVGQVCQVKGCFFVAQDGPHTVRVSFVDYSFFVPTDISGKTVTLMGELISHDLSAEEAEHFNQDTGSDTFAAGKLYEIVASSVVVPLN